MNPSPFRGPYVPERSYRIVKGIDKQALEDEMNALAKDGYRLVAVHDYHTHGLVIFMEKS